MEHGNRITIKIENLTINICKGETDKNEAREVKRHAEVGEYIKIIDPFTPNGEGYETGDILEVIASGYIGTAYVRTKEDTIYGASSPDLPIEQPFAIVLEREYVVLEGYEPAEPELPKFTYEGFKRGDFIVNCRTQEEADIFCAYLHGKGDKWCDGGNYIQNTEWRIFLENTCYSCGGSYCEKAFYESEGHTVIPFNAADLD